MAKCICFHWREFIDGIEQPHLRFKYCPWCGSELQLEAADYRERPVCPEEAMEEAQQQSDPP